MKLTFLGTAAGQSYPIVWCDCPNCTYAREHGGRNIRMHSSTLIDSDVLVDLNSCAHYTAARLGISLSGVRHLLVTHPHEDHLSADILSWRRAAPGALTASESERLRMISTRYTPVPLMTVYGGPFTRDALTKANPHLFDGTYDTQMVFREIRESERIESADLAFTPVRAQHEQPGFTHNYIIERGGKTLLYAMDTGDYDEDVLDLVLSRRYDGVVMESTFGDGENSYPGHMNRADNIRFRRQLIEKGCIRSDTPFFLSHICAHWTPPHDVFAPEMAREGFIVAYDGMTCEI